jgi:hypothetical protein
LNQKLMEDDTDRRETNCKVNAFLSLNMTSSSTPKLFELLQAEEPKWEEISQRLEENPKEALNVDPSTNNLTALHHAVMNRKHPYSSEYFSALKTLLQLNRGATTVQCNINDYTPLAYACSVDLRDDYLEDNAKVVEMLLEGDNNEALDMTSNEGLTPLSLHIRSISRQKFLQDQSKVASTTVLKLLAENSSRETLEEALETLYACNTSTVMQRFVQEESRARHNIQLFGRQTRASPGATEFWVWEWALLILRCVHDRIYGTDQALFQALHVASQITDCPTPFVVLAMRSFPGEARTPDRMKQNTPLHSVASWQLPEESPLCRKSMTVRTLASEYPAALETKNKRKKTPQDLEEASGSFVGTGN